ncbi:3-methyl-2-oxobutanoate hydroxymethyltransferase [Candidatus Neomarinimicrobiota bacterium]
MQGTVKIFNKRSDEQKPLAMVTAYDYTSAALAAAAGFKTLLVGDSLGMVIQGNQDTLGVTLDEIIYHTQAVVNGAPEAFVIADMPFLSYQPSIETAIISAGSVLKETGASAVKLEGGEVMVPQIRALIDIGIPVMGHIGMQPQSVNMYGGFGKRGKSASERGQLLQDARALDQCGVFAMVIENVPHDLAQELTKDVKTPTIGIGAGPGCDGQIQVFHDILGLNREFSPRHSRRFANIGDSIVEALAAYIADVQTDKFISQ